MERTDEIWKEGKAQPQTIAYVGKVAYELALPPHLQHVHNVVHVSILKKYNPDLKHVIEYSPIEIQSDLSYIEQLVEILDQREKTLRNKTVSLVRVLWRNPMVEESTWELESEMLEKYRHLFSQTNSEVRILLRREGCNNREFVNLYNYVNNNISCYNNVFEQL